MYFAAAFLASLLVSATALATPHAGQGMLRRHQHAALAKVRAAAPEPVSQPLEASAAIPKRRLRKRCQPRKTSIAPSASSAAGSSAAPASSISANPVNVAPSPIASSSQAAPPPPVASSSQAAPSSPPPPPAPSPSPSPSSQAPAPAPSSSSNGGTQSSSPFTGTQIGGDGTFYSTGLGACGITNNDSDLIAAVSQNLFDHFPDYNGVNPNTNPVCNKKVLVEYQGKQVTVTITDRCTGCSEGDLDFSPRAFNMLADPSVGRIHGIKWTWL